MSATVNDAGKRVQIQVTRDGWTSRLQMSIDCLDEDGSGDGYRLDGPKFNGSSEPVITVALTRSDADEIRSYLNRVWPAVEVSA